MDEADDRLGVLFGYRYLTNPLWFLLSWDHGTRDGFDYKRPKVLKTQIDFKEWCYPIKEQIQFNFIIKRLAKNKVTKDFKDCRVAFNQVTDAIIKFQKVQEAHQDRTDFYQPALTRNGKIYGKRYVRPDYYLDAQKKFLESNVKFKAILLKAVTKINIQSISQKLDIPSNLVATTILYLATGGQRVDKMSPVNFVDVAIGKPKILFTSAATREDFEQFMKDLKKDRAFFTELKKNFPVLRESEKIRPPYKYRFGGVYYIAVDVYKNKISVVNELMNQIDKLQQSELHGYRFKIDPGNTRNQMRDLTKNESKYFPSIDAMQVARERLKKKIQPLVTSLLKG